MADKKLLLELALNHQQKNKINLLENSLDNFKKWVAAKTFDLDKNLRTDNVLMFRPKSSSQELENTKFSPKSFRMGFFPQPNRNPHFFPLAAHALEREKNQKGKEKDQQNQLNQSLACSNCNEAGHNSMSCAKPPSSPKR